MSAASVLQLPVVLVCNRLVLNVISSSPAMQYVRDKSGSEEPQERETGKSHGKSRVHSGSLGYLGRIHTLLQLFILLAPLFIVRKSK